MTENPDFIFELVKNLSCVSMKSTNDLRNFDNRGADMGW